MPFKLTTLQRLVKFPIECHLHIDHAHVRPTFVRSDFCGVYKHGRTSISVGRGPYKRHVEIEVRRRPRMVRVMTARCCRCDVYVVWCAELGPELCPRKSCMLDFPGPDIAPDKSVHTMVLSGGPSAEDGTTV
jgi:hypothetical protein